MLKLFLIMGAAIWAMLMLQLWLPDAQAWEVRDDRDSHAWRFEAAEKPNAQALFKEEICELFTDGSECLPHFSVTGISPHSAGVEAKWKF